MSAIGSAEVFVAMTASGLRTSSSSAITRRFVAISSNTASITRSALRNPARSGSTADALDDAGASRRSKTPFFAASVVRARIEESPLATAAASRSRARTRSPDAAAAWAMPEPMKPSPTTPTFAMARGFPSPSKAALRWRSVSITSAVRLRPASPIASSPNERASASSPASMPFARPMATASIAASCAG